MMDNQTAQSMLNGLLAIKAEGPKRDQSGICNNLERLTDRAYSHWEMVELFKTWEHFSGDETFPVRHPNRKPDIAYLCAEKSIWDKKTQYGRMRWALLEHCIVQLQIQLSKT